MLLNIIGLITLSQQSLYPASRYWQIEQGIRQCKNNYNKKKHMFPMDHVVDKNMVWRFSWKIQNHNWNSSVLDSTNSKYPFVLTALKCNIWSTCKRTINYLLAWAIKFHTILISIGASTQVHFWGPLILYHHMKSHGGFITKNWF